MSKAILDISMSLDGFITDVDRSPQDLHGWIEGEMSGRPDAAVPDTWRPDVFGSVICGHRTYEDSLPWWGADGPSGTFRLPVVVVTHGNVTVPPGGVYTVARSIDDALAEARTLADGKDVTVMGGASIAQGFLRAALLDEIKIHLAPIILGSGTRLIDDIGSRHVRLEQLEVDQDSHATHLRYRVVRDSDRQPSALG